MGYQVYFLPVGEGEKSGDAIVVRFGNLYGKREEQQIIIIDGGFKNNGESIVEHIHNYFKTDKVDLVVSTHPDNDHSSGLSVVLENLKVTELWMHQPWKHTNDIAKLFEDGRITDNSIKEKLKKSLEDAYCLESTAQRNSIPIKEPFKGLTNSTKNLLVLAPSQNYYESLLPDFRCTPTPKFASMMDKILESMTKTVKSIAEDWNIETLNDDGETSAENNSSTILLLRCDDKSLLFTSDAGIPALTNAINYLDSFSFDYNSLRFVQMPHHGSKRNVGPTILNKILGTPKNSDVKLRSSYVSVSKDSTGKHPSKLVTNAFRRRGAYVYRTNGSAICHFHNAPAQGWSPIAPLEFFYKIEDE